MRKVCLTIPTNRPCGPAIEALFDEAAYAAETFGVEVHLLVLDSAEPGAVAEHAAVVAGAPAVPGVTATHLDENAQRAFLRDVIDRSGIAKPELVLDLMLPAAVSYGACTNRAFLIARALGCSSVHRRDSDSRYQVVEGRTVYPVHQELFFLGLTARDAAPMATESRLTAELADRPVTMVGSSFIGELSVDIADIRERDPGAYHDIVSLWAPGDWTAEQRRELVEESFTGAGDAAFDGDRSLLGLVDPMRVDMCNIAFHRVHEDVPLPPSVETIGSDYFLIHVVHDAALPGVLHNRAIENFHTPDRRGDASFRAYQLRLAKFFLSMLYFHHAYREMAAAGDGLLDGRHRVRAGRIADIVRSGTALDPSENVDRLDRLEAAYRRLGGRYAEVADVLTARRDVLLAEARQDMADFAVLIEAWGPLMRASADAGAGPVRR